MGKIGKIISRTFESHRFVISWTAVLLLFYISFMHNGYVFALVHSVVLTLSMILVSLIEGRLLVRHVLKKGRRFLFFVFNVVLVIGFAALFIKMQMRMSDIIKNLMLGVPKPEVDINWTVAFFIRTLIYTCVVSITAITYLERNEQAVLRESNELKIENLDMELRYLKSQINPHFLFNALNNIYSLVYTKDEKAPESVLKLSEMLRYVMVDCQADTLSLEKEMKFIDNYVDFQLMKLEEERDVKFAKDVKNWSFMLPPMIFQPVVENAFKYSRIENDPNGFIAFSVRQDENGLEFLARNSIKASSLPVSSSNNKNGSGIGLQNVKKRLSLHYKDRYAFETNETDNIYTVRIILK